MSNVDFIQEYLTAVANCATGDDLARFFHSEVVQSEYPNRFSPNGTSRDLGGILEAAERGREVLAGQTMELTSFFGGGTSAAIEFTWTGELAVATGGMKEGETLSAWIAAFFEFRDGLIYRQRNYDCYLPF